MAFGCAFFCLCFFRYAPGVSWVLVRSGVGSGFKNHRIWDDLAMTL